jgi:hypothetical protein
MLQNPLLKPKSRKIGELYSDPRNTEVEANLLYYRDRYEKILKERTTPWNEVQAKSKYEKARAAYYGYIEEQLADVVKKLEILPRLKEQSV